MTTTLGIWRGRSLPTRALMSVGGAGAAALSRDYDESECDEDSLSSYPTLGFEHVVPFDNCTQYPRVPKVIEPLIPWFWRDALRKKTDLKYGTENDTTARRTAARRVTRKPGVAGRIQDMQKE